VENLDLGVEVASYTPENHFAFNSVLGWIDPPRPQELHRTSSLSAV